MKRKQSEIHGLPEGISSNKGTSQRCFPLVTSRHSQLRCPPMRMIWLSTFVKSRCLFEMQTLLLWGIKITCSVMSLLVGRCSSQSLKGAKLLGACKGIGSEGLWNLRLSVVLESGLAGRNCSPSCERRGNFGSVDEKVTDEGRKPNSCKDMRTVKQRDPKLSFICRNVQWEPASSGVFSACYYFREVTRPPAVLPGKKKSLSKKPFQVSPHQWKSL